MPLALRDLQAAFAAHLLGADSGDLAAEALATTFPTVQALVGEDFFRMLARAFVGQSPPNQPVLAEYGAGFPAFIAGHDAARDLPYLADIARLDWALNL